MCEVEESYKKLKEIQKSTLTHSPKIGIHQENEQVTLSDIEEQELLFKAPTKYKEVSNKSKSFVECSVLTQPLSTNGFYSHFCVISSESKYY